MLGIKNVVRKTRLQAVQSTRPFYAVAPSSWKFRSVILEQFTADKVEMCHV